MSDATIVGLVEGWRVGDWDGINDGWSDEAEVGGGVDAKGIEF